MFQIRHQNNNAAIIVSWSHFSLPTTKSHQKFFKPLKAYLRHHWGLPHGAEFDFTFHAVKSHWMLLFCTCRTCARLVDWLWRHTSKEVGSWLVDQRKTNLTQVMRLARLICKTLHQFFDAQWKALREFMSRLSFNHFSNGVNISTLVTFNVKFACV